MKMALSFLTVQCLLTVQLCLTDLGHRLKKIWFWVKVIQTSLHAQLQRLTIKLFFFCVASTAIIPSRLQGINNKCADRFVMHSLVVAFVVGIQQNQVFSGRDLLDDEA